MTRIKNLEAKVLNTLAYDEQSRNSDIRLTAMIWLRFYKHLLKVQNGIVLVPLSALGELPREDNIKRIRAKLQNGKDHLYPPTNWEVAKKRGFEEDKWRGYLDLPVAGVNNQHL